MCNSINEKADKEHACSANFGCINGSEKKAQVLGSWIRKLLRGLGEKFQWMRRVCSIVNVPYLQVDHAFFHPRGIDFGNPIDVHAPRAPLSLRHLRTCLIFMLDYYEKINRLILFIFYFYWTLSWARHSPPSCGCSWHTLIEWWIRNYPVEEFSKNTIEHHPLERPRMHQCMVIYMQKRLSMSWHSTFPKLIKVR